MKNNVTKRIKLGNIFYVLFFTYLLIVVNVEWINFIAKMVDTELPFGVAELTAAILMGVLFYLTRNHWEVSKLKVETGLIVGILIILVFGIITSVYPDKAYDTYNYHLIAQNPRFENYFTEDFGYGNFQVWGFRLPDRLFFYFRYLLGFRFGTFLNPLVLIVSYTQIYGYLGEIIAKTFARERGKFASVVCNKTLWGLIILLPLDVVLMCGTYYADLLAFPIALEAMRILIMQRDEFSTESIAYFALVNGLWIGLKLTNIVYVIPCVLIYIVMHFGQMRLKDWVIALVAGLWPFVVYLVFNYVCTGNPVFPYYNTLFQSRYFSVCDFKDTRWGGSNLLEKLFWIFYAVVVPEYRQCEIYDQRPGAMAVGLLGAVMLTIVAVVGRIRKKQLKKDNPEFWILLIITILSSVLWAFTTGYSRYFSFGKALWGVLAFGFVVYMAGNFRTLGRIAGVVCLLACTVCLGMNVKSYISGRNWSWTAIHVQTFREQMKYVFKDRDITTDYGVDADLFILTDQLSMGVAELIDDNSCVINLRYPLGGNLDAETLYAANLNSAKHIYDIHERRFSDIETYIAKLNVHGLYATDFAEIEVGAGSYELIAVSANSGRENTLWVADSGELKVSTEEIEGDRIISFIAGEYYGQTDSVAIIKLYLTDGIEERLLFATELKDDSIDRYEVPTTIEAGESGLVLRVYTASGELFSDKEAAPVFVMNLNID